MPKQAPRKRPAAPHAHLPGRPAVLAGGRRINVYLDARSLERARQLGAGNVSEGIRLALERG